MLYFSRYIVIVIGFLSILVVTDLSGSGEVRELYEVIDKQIDAGKLENSERVLLHLLDLSRKEGEKEIEIYALIHLYRYKIRVEKNSHKGLPYLLQACEIAKEEKLESERLQLFDLLIAHHTLYSKNEFLSTEVTRKPLFFWEEERNINFLLIGWVLLSLLLFYLSRKQQHLIAIKHRELEDLNQTKDRIFSVLAHDLNGIAMTYSRLSEKISFLLRKNRPAEIIELGNHIDKEWGKFYSIIDSLLNWSSVKKIEGFKITKSVDINKAILTTIDLLDLPIRQKKIVAKTILTENIFVQVSEEDLMIILRNVINNAIKYSPTSDTIEIITKANGEKYIEVHICDNGIGIKQEIVQSIALGKKLKSLQGTNNEIGLGLGLHLCTQLLTENFGELLFKNQKEATGTICIIRLLSSIDLST